VLIFLISDLGNILSSELESEVVLRVVHAENFVPEAFANCGQCWPGVIDLVTLLLSLEYAGDSDIDDLARGYREAEYAHTDVHR